MGGLFDLIGEARQRLSGVINATPLIHSSSLSRLYGFECYLKLENLQKTGSFKVRGAYNRISTLTDDEKSRGVVTASMGNHAQGVAWASTLLGVRSVVVMPETAPIAKHVATKGYGGKVVFRGRSFDEALAHALELAEEEGMAFIPPFDDELVMAGQGTVGLEIIDDLPDVDTVIVPVGGGGLISGVAAAVKGVKAGVRVVGVEAGVSASCIASIEAGRPVAVEERPTVADGIAVKKVGDKTFPVIRDLVDSVVAVGEESIAASILQVLERKKLIVEGAGAVPLAAAVEGKLPGGTGKAVMVLSGGNIDVTTLERVIRLGLIKEGRVTRLAAVIADEPGSLAALSAEIAELRGNILHVVHQRDAVEVPIGRARLDIVIEVEGPLHSERIMAGLRTKGYDVRGGDGGR